VRYATRVTPFRHLFTDNFPRHFQVQLNQQTFGHFLISGELNAVIGNIHGGNRFFAENSFPCRMKTQRNSHDEAVPVTTLVSLHTNPFA